MKPASKSWLLIFVFVGGFLGRAVIYSHTHFDSHEPAALVLAKKIRDDFHHDSHPDLMSMAKSGKSKRRLDCFGFSKLFISQTPYTLDSSSTSLSLRDNPAPLSVDLSDLLQPPC